MGQSLMPTFVNSLVWLGDAFLRARREFALSVNANEYVRPRMAVMR
jgi:hypothetical protein